MEILFATYWKFTNSSPKTKSMITEEHQTGVLRYCRQYFALLHLYMSGSLTQDFSGLRVISSNHTF